MKKIDLDNIIYHFKTIVLSENINIKPLNKIRLIIKKEKIEDDNKNYLSKIAKTALEVLAVLDEEEQKYFLKNVPDFVKISMFNSEEKLQILEEGKENEYLAFLIVDSLGYTDDEKIELLDKINPKYQVVIIESINNDDKKISQMYRTTDEEDKARIISSLKSDDNKIEQLENLKDEKNRCLVIRSIVEDDKKIPLIDTLESEEDRLVVAKTVKEQEKILLALSKVNSNYKRAYELALKLESDEEIDGKDYKYKKIGLPEDMTVGIEIESEGKLYGVLPNHIAEWKTDENEDSFYEQGGIEYVSPIMYDTKQDVVRIYMVNEILENLGMGITKDCGGHVHIGADYIETEEGFKELVELWGNAEEVYFLISNKPGELPRSSIKEYAMPVSKTYEMNLRNKDNFLEDAKEVQYDRYTSINLLNVNNGKNTIEFRISNGTLDGDTWVENIRLYGRTVQVANELRKNSWKKGKRRRIN